MKYLLDTNVCIGIMNGRSYPLLSRIEKVDDNDICIASIICYELYYGAFKSLRVSHNLNTINSFISSFIVLDFTIDCAVICGELRVDLEKQGLIIGAYDLQIASIALSNNLILVTHNTKEFSRVKNLRIEDWEL